MVKRWADDVDTLLVFVSFIFQMARVLVHEGSTLKAGLFSAVLSTFLSVSYGMLQVDNSQSTVSLLSRISLQLDGSSNSSATASVADTQQFRPTQAAIWINCLWFLSLVLSLYAAFFGIVFKQWLREYMKWSAPLGDPKENILVRQIRHEAWQEFDAEGFIHLLPSLLEFAVILFFLGLEILLWTTNFIVATVATIMTASFFVNVVRTTLMPLRHRRSPYKSYTSRMLAETFDDCTKAFREFHAFLLRLLRQDSSGASFRQTWRSSGKGVLIHHLRNLMSRLQNGSTYSVDPWRDWEIRDSLLRKVRNGAGRVGAAAEVFRGEFQEYVGSACTPDEVLLEMGKAAILWRTLDWVSKASQDKQVLANVATSAESIHDPDTSYDIRYLSSMHLLAHSLGDSKTPTSSERQALLPLLHDSHALPELNGTTTVLLQVLRLCYHMPATSRARRVGGHLAVTPQQGFGLLDRTWHHRDDWSCTPLRFPILLHLLVGDIRSTVLSLLRHAKSRPPSVEPIAVGCRVMGLLCALHRLIRAQLIHPEFTGYWFDDALLPLIDAYNALANDPQADCVDEDWCPGLRTSLIATICTFMNVQVTYEGKLKPGDHPVFLAQHMRAKLSCVSKLSLIFLGLVV